jgi:predicted O-methyltransferase YrrM
MTTDIINKLKPNSIYEIIPEEFFFERGHGYDYLDSKIYYEYYYAISKFYQPSSILEIGVRFGYSLGSMIKGSDKIQFVKGIDCEDPFYGVNTLKTAEINIKKYINPNVKCEFLNQDSHSIKELDQKYDLIHIDGDHSYEGKIKDLNLALDHCKVLVVDDYFSFYQVANATNDWIMGNRHKIKSIYIVYSLRGALVIEFV